MLAICETDAVNDNCSDIKLHISTSAILAGALIDLG